MSYSGSGPPYRPGSFRPPHGHEGLRSSRQFASREPSRSSSSPVYRFPSAGSRAIEEDDDAFGMPNSSNEFWMPVVPSTHSAGQFLHRHLRRQWNGHRHEDDHELFPHRAPSAGVPQSITPFRNPLSHILGQRPGAGSQETLSGPGYNSFRVHGDPQQPFDVLSGIYEHALGHALRNSPPGIGIQSSFDPSTFELDPRMYDSGYRRNRIRADLAELDPSPANMGNFQDETYQSLHHPQPNTHLFGSQIMEPRTYRPGNLEQRLDSLTRTLDSLLSTVDRLILQARVNPSSQHPTSIHPHNIPSPRHRHHTTEHLSPGHHQTPSNSRFPAARNPVLSPTVLPRAHISMAHYSHPVHSPPADATCHICLEPHSPTEPLITPHVCAHTFHTTCLEMWVNGVGSNCKKCPACRRLMV